MGNSKAIQAIVIVACGLIVSLWVTLSVITDDQNALAQLAGYMAVGSFVIGLLFGGRAILLLLLLIAYGDLVKRGLVLFGSLSYVDIGKVLVSGPLTLAGICVNLLWGAISGRIQMSKLHWHIFTGCVVVALVSAAYSMFYYASFILGLKNVVLGSAYMMLPWVMVMIIKTPDQILRFMKTFLIVFFPVALYGINQGFFGMSDFEIEYLKSGYTLEARQLKNDVMRIPSTMNAARSLSVTMALCIMIFISMRVCKARSWLGMLHPLTLLIVPTFGLAMIFSLTRIGWAAALVFPVLAVAFAGKKRTIGIYGVGVLLLSLLVAYSEAILEKWEVINKVATEFVGADTAFGQQATSLSTLSARLVGWRNLTKDSSLWSAFGVDEATLDNVGDTNLETGLHIDNMSGGMTHDALTQLIVKYGLVPFSVIGIGALVMLFWFHSLPFQFRDPNDRRLSVMILGCIVAIAVSGLSSGMHVPINALLFFFVGMGLSMAVRAKELKTAPVASAPNPDELVGEIPRVSVPAD